LLSSSLPEVVFVTDNNLLKNDPLWAGAQKTNQLVDLSRSTLYELAAAGKIRSASLRDPGAKKGRRLFYIPSVLAFIESRASGGLPQESTETAAA
jgi:hypothetical protein